jgi:hypothetical protein
MNPLNSIPSMGGRCLGEKPRQLRRGLVLRPLLTHRHKRQWLDADIAQTQSGQKHVPIIAKVLDGKKTATFFQLDRRIAMMLELQVASQMPLVQDQQ